VKEWSDDGSDAANNKPAAAPAPTSK